MAHRGFAWKLWLVLVVFVIASTGIMPVALAAEPGIPENVTLKRGSGNNTVAWQAVEGAEGYKIYAAGTPEGKYKLLSTTKATSFVHKKAPETQFYMVRAYVGKKMGKSSSPVGSVAGAKGLKFTGNTPTSIKISWKASAHATEYVLKTSGSAKGPWKTVEKDIRGTSYTLPLESMETQYYYVLSSYQGMTSGKSEVLAVFAPMKDVKVVCEESYGSGPSDKLNIKWAGNPGAAQYEVFRATLPSQNFKSIGTTKKTYFADTRHPTKAYAYKVRPVYGNIVGAESEAVTLWSGMPENVLPAEKIQSDTNILLLVNKRAQVVTAYTRDENGKFTVVLRHMICSTGSTYERTPLGEHVISGRMREWYQYPSGVYIRYPTIYTRGLYFHSVLYSSSKSVMSSTIARLGTRQSLGCVRLKVNEAKWVYNYCGKGTKVVVVDGKSIPELKNALKPKTVKVK